MFRSCLLALALLTGCPSSQPAPSAPRQPAAARPASPAPALAQLEGRVADLVMDLYVDELEVQAAAALELGSMGAAAAPALPELITCAATEPREGGSRDSDLDPGHLADREPTAECAAAIAAISAEDPDALVAAMAVPLSIKERALAALVEVGAPAVTGAAAVYLDACGRAAGAGDQTVRRHLETTADAALAVLATSPDAAADALGSGGECASRGAARVRTLASAP